MQTAQRRFTETHAVSREAGARYLILLAAGISFVLSVALWFGGHEDVTLRRIAKWGDGWIMLAHPAGPVADAEFAKLRGYVKEQGRDPKSVGIEVWVSTGEGGPDDWRKQFLAWKDAGVTHITVNSTYRRGPHKRIAGNTMTVNLTGVLNAQVTSVTLNNVSYGVGTGNITVSMGALLGDTNGDRVVNAGDSTQTRNRSGSLTDGATFRSDVNLDGVVNSGDASIVRAASGTGLGGFELAGEKQK